MKKLISISLILLASNLLADEPLNETQLQQLQTLQVFELQLPAQKQLATNSKKTGRVQPQPLMVARAAPVQASLASLTEWQTIDEISVLRLKLHGAKAKHLNLGFEQVRLPGSANLFILDGVTNALLQQ